MSKAQEYIEEPETTKKWSFLGWGLLFITIWTVALMFILEAALQPRDSFVGTVIAYMLGLVGLIVFAVLIRKSMKLFLVIPLVFIIIFGAGFLLHYVNAPVYNPIAPVSERLLNIVDEADSFSDTTIWQDMVPPVITENMNDIKKYSPASFVVDLILILPVFYIGLISVTWITQLFTGDFSRKNFLELFFKILFSVVFFIGGLILFPTIHLLVAGVTGLGTNLGIGLLYFVNGFAVIGDFQNADQTDVNLAVDNFDLAAEWFQKGGDDIATFLAALGLIPYGITDIADDIGHLFSAVFILFTGVAPFVNASYQIYQGFDYISRALNFSAGGSTLSAQDATIKKTVNDYFFNKGLDYVNDGLSQFDDSSVILDEALEEVKSVDWTDIEEALNGLPFNIGESIGPFFDQVENYIGIFEQATDLIDVLISKPFYDNDTQSDYATLIHFFKGTYNLMKAFSIIGNSTNFVGTDVYFDRAGEHFNITRNAFNTPEMDTLLDSDTPLLNNTVAFLVDMTSVAANMSFFGGDLGPVLLDLNGTLSSFDSGYENVTDYSPIISDLDASRISTGELVISADALDIDLDVVQEKANNNTYGEFSTTAYEFSNLFRQCNLTTNARNADAIANSFYYLFSGMSDLKTMNTEVNDGYIAFNVTDYPTATTHFTNANTSLTSSINNMWSASYYINQTESGGMFQLGNTRNATASIYFSLISIQSDMIDILNIASGGSPTPLEIAEVNTKFTNIINALATVNDDLGSMSTQ